MAGSPIKHERNRLIREAILWGREEGKNPAEFLLPFVVRLKELALGGDMVAMKELFDRIDGKSVQEVSAEGMGLDDLESALVAISERRRERIRALQEPRPELLIGEGSGE